MRAFLASILLAVVLLPTKGRAKGSDGTPGDEAGRRCPIMSQEQERWVGKGLDAGEIFRMVDVLEGRTCGRPADLALAARLYDERLPAGDCAVAFRLGWNVLQGSPGTASRGKARDHFRHGAMCFAGGLDDDFRRFVTVYMGSRGVPPELTEALDWVGAIDKGPPERQYEMALAALAGASIPKVPWAAELWMTRAAQADFVPAQYRLARWLLDGTLGRKDESSAQLLLIEAARAGLPQAQADLGMFHAKKGDQIGDFRAYVWLRLAERNGMAVGSVLREVAGRLSDDQKAGGDHMIATGNLPGR